MRPDAPDTRTTAPGTPSEGGGEGPASGVLASNVVYVTLSSALATLCLFVANLVVIRTYGMVEHGRFVLVVSVAGAMIVLSDLGLASKYGVRRIAQARASAPRRVEGVISAMLTVLLVFAAILGICTICLAGPLSRWLGTDVLGMRLAGIWVLAWSGVRACTMIAVGLERMSYLMAMFPPAEGAKLLWVIVCAVSGLGLRWVFIGWTGAYLLAGIISWAFCRRLLQRLAIRVRLRRITIRQGLRFVRAGTFYYVVFLGAFALPHVMQLLTGAVSTQSDVSVLQVCFMLAMVTRLLGLTVSVAVFPRVASIDASPDGDHATTVTVLREVAGLLGLVGTLLFALFWALGQWGMHGIYGSEFVSTVPVLLVLTCALSVDNHSQQLDQVLMATGHARRVALVEAGRYAILLGGGGFLIGRWGALGAGCAVLLASGANAAAKMVLARRQISSVGAGALLRTCAVFGAVTAVGATVGLRYLLPAVWLVSALLVGLLRPRDLARWVATVLSVLTGSRTTRAAR